MKTQILSFIPVPRIATILSRIFRSLAPFIEVPELHVMLIRVTR